MPGAQQWPPPATQPSRGSRIANSSPPPIGQPQTNNGDGIVGERPPPAPPSSVPSQPAPRIAAPTAGQAPQRGPAHKYTPTSRDSYGYDPTSRDPNLRRVQAPTETLQGQLTGIMDENNVLLQRARTRGNQYAAERGLNNSSLGAQFAQAAVLDEAIPIAQHDAGVYGTAARDNQAYQDRASQDNQVATNRSREYGAAERNLASRDNQAAFNRALEYNAEAKNLADQGNHDAAMRVVLADLDAKTRTNIAQLNVDSQRYVTQMEQRHERILRTQVAAKDGFNQMTNNIAHIEANVKDPDVRQSMKNDQLYMYEQYLNMVEDSTALEGTEMSHAWKERFQGTAA